MLSIGWLNVLLVVMLLIFVVILWYVVYKCYFECHFEILELLVAVKMLWMHPCCCFELSFSVGEWVFGGGLVSFGRGLRNQNAWVLNVCVCCLYWSTKAWNNIPLQWEKVRFWLCLLFWYVEAGRINRYSGKWQNLSIILCRHAAAVGFDRYSSMRGFKYCLLSWHAAVLI